jgi:hypothetical protein
VRNCARFFRHRFLTSLTGLAINFFGNATRREISATSFTVLGCMNKLLAVLVDVSVTRTSTLAGTSCLVCCIFGGLGYSLSIDAEKFSNRSAESIPQDNKEEVHSDYSAKVLLSLKAHKFAYGMLLTAFIITPLLLMLQPRYGNTFPRYTLSATDQ